MLLAISVLFCCVYVWRFLTKKYTNVFEGWFIALYISIAVFFLIALIVFFAQIGDLMAPNGIAIHQLIKDIRG
jgi:hypothetical protein